MMNKNDLRTGMIVELKNGEIGVVMLDTNHTMDIIKYKGGGFDYISAWNEDLTNSRARTHWDIMKVFSTYLGDEVFPDQLNNLLWERKEFEPYLYHEFGDTNLGVIGEKCDFTDSLCQELHVGDVVDIFKNGKRTDTQYIIYCHENNEFYVSGYCIHSSCLSNNNIRILKKHPYTELSTLSCTKFGEVCCKLNNNNKEEE